jgi:hypothetical protein
VLVGTPAASVLVSWWSHERELQAEDRKEVRQEADYAFLRAVAGYGKGLREGQEPSRFGTYLNLVVRDHLDKWERGRQRAEHHYDRSTAWEPVLERWAEQSHRDLCGADAPDPRADDPVSNAEWDEFWDRLRERVQHLGSEYRGLWERLWDGRSLHQAAGELDLSYDHVRRMFGKIKPVVRDAGG